MPLLLFVSIVGLGIEYMRLYEKQDFFSFDRDDKLIGLVGGFPGAAQLWFWILARERSARACLGYKHLYCCGPIFISQMIIVTIIPLELFL